MNTQPPGIDRLRAATIGVTDLERSTAFYTRVWGLEPVHRKPDAVFLRAAGTHHHVLVLQTATTAGLISSTWGTASVEDLHALHERLVGAGVRTEQPPRKLAAPGGGHGFAFHDDEGRVFKVVALREDYAEPQAAAARPVRLAHIVLNSVNSQWASQFLIDHAGFRLSDRTGVMHFLRCNRDHHAVAFANTGSTSVHHLAFEMASWNDLMFGVGRLKEAGHSVQWGVGRHGPGDNVFAYFVDPDGLAIEYTAEVQQIDEETHQPGTPEQWKRPANRMDQWGHAEPMSEALAHAMHGDTQKAGVARAPGRAPS